MLSICKEIKQPDFTLSRPRAATAIEDWTVSLDRQLELYEYLQTSQGAFAAGVTNSWNKNYEDPPQEYKVMQ